MVNFLAALTQGVVGRHGVGDDKLSTRERSNVLSISSPFTTTRDPAHLAFF